MLYKKIDYIVSSFCPHKDETNMDIVPEEYKCPISMEIMKDPVIGTDGHTYEREAITEWLTTRAARSPMTRVAMNLDDLKPNYALRAAIERWLTTHTPAPLQPPAKTNGAVEKDFSVTVCESDSLSALTITPTTTTPMETVCIAVLDTSGSMGGSAMAQEKRKEGHEFSRLDLVKHSMKTLATLMNSQYETTPSSLGIITFASSAKIVMPVTSMNVLGHSYVSSAIDSLTADGGTNIWDGLRLALDQVAAVNPNTNVQILLLTDGEPTPDYIPLRGIQTTLQKKLASLPIRPSIHTFGFGTQLDSQLLEDICMIGGGSYGFIPDCSMVGTVFINWCTKSLLTLAHHMSVTIGETVHPLGDCILGTPQTIVIPSSSLTSDSVQIRYDHAQAFEVTVTKQSESSLYEFYLHKLQTAVKLVKEAPSYVVAKLIAEEHFKGLYLELEALPNKDTFITDIQLDIWSADANEGQLMKAVEHQEWYDSWGQNHIIAYHRALALHQCTNFKDKVLQHFAGPEFQTLQEKGITTFSDLPAPHPSIRNVSWSMNPSASSFALPAMADFVTASGGCFSGSCVILTDEGRPKYVKDLKRGDMVWGGHMIRAVVYTALEEPVQMVKFSTGLLITPWHPIRNSPVEPWVFPAEMPQCVQGFFDIKGYYNLVLDSGHVVEINGYQVCTLGHGFTDNDVIRHPYFGTDAVLDDLKMYDGWAEGLVQLSPTNIQRDRYTRLVTKL